ncbi:O-antigen translocase [Flavobacterium urocaniciphilum]|uniref:Polysaccharide transporter, PST family n=1 Tax=Flavobacterium urocaniciphilum TaxID=1299341 RepID=A0A1H8Z215_9FLAO|nr:O-antigen translocase [Flavobacterium urocaniciphilum]SEP57638.1 polysaccharide transporter, PST family [Flavobacterium urocaniciphilum]
MSEIKKIIQQPLFKITSLNSIHILLKLIFGFITSKALAIFVGANGMAFVGNFRAFLNVIENFSLLGIQNAVVKYVTEYQNDKVKLKSVLSTFGLLLISSSILISFGLILGTDYLSKEIFNHSEMYCQIFYVLAILFPLFVFSTFCISVVNGFQEYKKVIYIQIISSCIALLFSVFLIYYYTTFGALIALVLAPVFVFFVSIFYLSKHISITDVFSIQSFDLSVLKNLSEYVLMALVSGVIGSFVLLEIRTDVIAITGLKNAGIYEGLQRISSYYLLFISSIITIYFYPKLSASTSNTKEIIVDYLKNIISIFIIGLILLFILRKFIIQVLFSTEFEAMESLFLGQLVGDVFKAISLIFGTILIAKKQTKAFIITEIVSLFIMYFSTNWMLHAKGINGIVIAHAFTYFMYLLVLVIYFRKTFR